MTSEWSGTAWEGSAAPVQRAGPTAVAVTVTPSMVAPQAVPYVDSRAVVGLSAVWRCVTLIADAIADMPWQEWTGDTRLPLSRLTRRPMATMTRREWTWRIVATEALYNVAYCLHIGGTDSRGKPWSLLPVPPALIQPFMPDPFGLIPPTQYTVAGQLVQADQLTIIRRAPFPNMTDQVSSLLDLARRQFSAYVAADVHMSRYWNSGGPTLTVLTTDQELDNDAAEGIAERWVARRAMGADYPAVLGRGAKAEPWGADPTTQSAVESRREITADVGRYFGVPTRILNAPAGDSETYSNVENDAIDLYRYTLRGYAGPIEDAISELLPGDYIEGRRMELNPSRLLQGNLVDRASAWNVLVTSGIADTDEARVTGFGLPPRATPPVADTTATAPAESGVAVTIGG